MTQHPWLDPSAFFFDGGPTGVLLIHGFTGAPPEMRPMGAYLAAQGYTVSGPRLAGHGTTSQDLQHTRWQDWAGSAGVALTQLQARCERVFVGGLSLGSLVALHLATYHPEVAGLVPMAPALIVAHKLTHLASFLKRGLEQGDDPGAGNDLTDPQADQRIWCYPVMPLAAVCELFKLQRIVRRKLDCVTQPLLIFQGRCDRQVSLESAPLLYDSVRSEDKALVWLENSGHCLTVDSEREAVWQKTHQWIRKRAQGR